MKAYSLDLRTRIFNYAQNHTIRETAEVFSVSTNTVFLLRKLFFQTGGLKPRTKKAENRRIIKEEGEAYLETLLSFEPDLTLEELCDRYEEKYGLRVSIGTMHNTLKRLNITYKKKKLSDPKKDSAGVEKLKEEYDAELEKIAPENRYYYDETGACLNMTPPFAGSKKGQPAYDKAPVSPGKTVNVATVLAEDGIQTDMTSTYTVSLIAQLFVAYLERYIKPVFKDSPKTLILDRHPVHCAHEVKAYLKNNRIRHLYLPPYSPELNPIEEAFSKVKNYIKKRKPRTVDDLLAVLKEALSSITQEEAENYFNHAFQFSS